MAYGAGGGMGEALMDISRMMMGYQMDKNKDKQAEKRKKMADEAMKALEEARVARTESYLKKGDPKAQSPWMSKEAANYASPQGIPDEVRVQEYNSQNKPLGTRPGTEAETQKYMQGEEALAANKAAAEAKANRQNIMDASRLQRDADASAADQSRTRYHDAKLANPERFRSNGAAPPAPDYDKMIDNANKVLGAIEDPEIKAKLQTQVNEAILKLNPKDGTPPVDAPIAAQMLKIALREARELEAAKGGKKPRGNAAEPTASGKKL